MSEIDSTSENEQSILEIEATDNECLDDNNLSETSSKQDFDEYEAKSDNSPLNQIILSDKSPLNSDSDSNKSINDSSSSLHLSTSSSYEKVINSNGQQSLSSPEFKNESNKSVDKDFAFDKVQTKETEMEDSLASKTTIFEGISIWENDRVERCQKFNELFDPLIEDIQAYSNDVKLLNTKIVKFLKSRYKMYNEFITRMRATNSNQKQSKNLVNKDSTNEEELGKMESPPKFTKSYATLNSINFPSLTCWPNVFNDYSEQEAIAYEKLVQFIEQDLIQNKLNDACQDFEKGSVLLITRLKDCRNRLRSQYKESMKAWVDFEKQLKYITDPKRKLCTNPADVKEPKDSWLYERRYLHTAIGLNQLQLHFYSLMIQALNNFYKLEQWRLMVFSDSIVAFSRKVRETAEMTAATFGSIHAFIDYNGYIEEKEEFLAGQHIDSVNKSSYRTQFMHGDVTDIDYSKNNNVNKNWESSELFTTAKNLISIGAPESKFLIKQGHVKRYTTSGLFSKWSEGLLCITWDRFLHIFRSHDDASPVWSVYVPHVEIRIHQEKENVQTIELREKKSSLVSMGAKVYTFRTFTETDQKNWLAILSLASTQDDLEYRREALKLV